MEISIRLIYIAHNGSTQLYQEKITHIPNIGACIKFDELRDSSCTGFFVITSVECIKNNSSMNYEIVASETNEDIYKKGLNQLIEMFTT